MELKVVVKKHGSKINESIVTPRDVYQSMKFLEKADRENLYVLHLDAKKHISAKELIGLGTLDACLAHPREVFKGAFLHNSSCIVLVHNHPSGDSTPSDEDKNLVQRIEEVGRTMCIPLDDSVIIGRREYSSHREGGYRNRLGCDTGTTAIGRPGAVREKAKRAHRSPASMGAVESLKLMFSCLPGVTSLYLSREHMEKELQGKAPGAAHKAKVIKEFLKERAAVSLARELKEIVETVSRIVYDQIDMAEAHKFISESR